MKCNCEICSLTPGEFAAKYRTVQERQEAGKVFIQHLDPNRKKLSDYRKVK